MDNVLDKFPDAIITENPEYVKFSLDILSLTASVTCI